MLLAASPLAVLDAATRGALVAVLLLLAVVMGRERARAAAVPVGLALAAGLIVQVLWGLPAVDAALPRAWVPPGVGVSVANSVLFWLFAWALFDDDYRPRAWQAGVWGAVAAIGAAGAWWCAPGVPLVGGLALLAAAKNWLPLLFAVLALAAAARQWRNDLVERRRRLRGLVVGLGALDTVIMVGARLAAPQGRVDGWMAWLDVALLLVIALVMALRLLRLGSSELFPPAAAEPVAVEPVAAASPGDAAVPAPGPEPEPDEADQRLAEALRQAMDRDRAYADEALSVASLAARLRVPEYRLRRVINQQLGFRNFNAYVNGFRLAEARAALADPARRHLPVLTLALEAGFGSIGPFNRAFKADTGLTPTEFRRQHLADS